MRENDSKAVLFDGWNSWLSYARNAVTGLAKGVFGVLFAIVMGLVSLIYHSGVFLIDKIRKWPLSSFLIVTVMLSAVMVMNFVSLSSKAKTYEYQRDSIGYDMDLLMETYFEDSDSVRIYINSLRRQVK